MSKIYKVINKNSNVLVEGQPKLPTAEQLEPGEIAINYAASGETLSIKNSNNRIVTFSCDDKFNESFRVMSKAMCDLDDRVLALEAISAITIGDLIETDAELENVTTSGKVVDALLIKDINNDIDGIEASAGTFNTRITNLETSAGTLDTRLSNLEASAITIGDIINTEEAFSALTASGKVVDAKLIKDVIDNIEVPYMEEITWSALKSMRDGGTLTPGMWYRITDYNTTTVQSDTQAAGHAFDVIVLATDVNKLSEEARAIRHSGDTYFSASTLEGWKIWYCLDNDTNRFAWADSGATGRGVIYRMIDEWNNDCPYDFKNIQFKRYEINACPKSPDLVGLYSINGINGITVDTATTFWCYTFSMINLFENIIDDVSVFQEKYISDENAYYTTHDNIFESYFEGAYSNEKEYIVYINKLPNNAFVTDTDICDIEEDYSRGIFYGFYSNTFGNNCGSNTFGNDCGFNTFGNDCGSNTFGNNCGFNTFGNNCGSNTFGNKFDSNAFGNKCGSNTFGSDCGSNTFGNNCNSNTFGSNCGFNTFGNGCGSNTFGNDCYHNAFGNSCRNIMMQKDYVYYIIVENGNQYIDITSTQTTSSSNNLRNFKISQGVNNTTTIKTISHNTVNDTFQTIYANDASGNTVAVNIADIAGVATLLSQI